MALVCFIGLASVGLLGMLAPRLLAEAKRERPGGGERERVPVCFEMVLHVG